MTKLSKKLVALLLAVVMTIAMSATAFAADITINDAVNGQTYSAYKLFDVTTSGEGENANYSYSLSAEETTLKGLLEDAGLRFVLSADGSRYYVSSGLEDETAAANLAEYLHNNVTVLGTPDKTTIGDEGTATLSGLAAGYYFVTTTTGSLCILNTTDAIDIKEKNEEPKIEKKVTAEDPDTAQIGDMIPYQITITAQPGAENYVLHDKMSDGLSLDVDSIKVQVDGTDLSAENYTLNTDALADDCDFEISFTKEYLDSITSPTVIVVTYEAMLNENAIVGKDPNTNKAILDYGENSDLETTPDETTDTYTYDFTLEKIDGTDKQRLDGAEFKLYDAAEDGNIISFVYDEVKDTYRVAKPGEGNTTDTIVVGSATISGLAGKNYWLEETKAPDGYNMLTERVQVTFNKLEDNFAGSDFVNQKIENQAGTLLPSTGGMGTTVIYVVGAVLVIGAGIVLVVRRRMNADR